MFLTDTVEYGRIPGSSHCLERADLTGEWPDRHPWSAPGPLYTTLMSTRSLVAFCSDRSELLLYDSQAEFLWRQPVSQAERTALLEAMLEDDVRSYQIDGNSHWSEALVREWIEVQVPEIMRWVNGEEFSDALISTKRMSSAYVSELRVRILNYYRGGIQADLDCYIAVLRGR